MQTVDNLYNLLIRMGYKSESLDTQDAFSDISDLHGFESTLVIKDYEKFERDFASVLKFSGEAKEFLRWFKFAQEHPEKRTGENDEVRKILTDFRKSGSFKALHVVDNQDDECSVLVVYFNQNKRTRSEERQEKVDDASGKLADKLKAKGIKCNYESEYIKIYPRTNGTEKTDFSTLSNFIAQNFDLLFSNEEVDRYTNLSGLLHQAKAR